MNAIFGDAQPGPNYRRGHGSELTGNPGNNYAPTQFKQLNRALNDARVVNEKISKQRQDS